MTSADDRIAALEAELAELRAHERATDRILEVVPGGIVHVAPDGAILRANTQAQRFLGLGYDALTRRYTFDFGGKTYKEDGTLCSVEEYPVSACIRTGEEQPPMTIGVEQPSGQVRWAIFTAMPDRGGAVVTFVDITERKASEEERQRMNERLQLADRLASVGTLAAGVAHEINNPLTFVLGNLALAEDPRTAPDEVPRLIAEAREGAERVSAIVRNLGRFARVDEGVSAPFDLRSAVDTALAMVRGELRHRARIEVTAAPVPPVDGSEGQVVQVLLNLLVNAAQAIEPGNVADNQVSVAIAEERGHGVVVVRDSGVGMAPDVLKRAFDPFFTTKPVGQGSGLGLAISHAIVDAMGGTIELRSAPGQGTVARVALPVCRGQRMAAPLPIRSRLPSVRLRILVVDDEPAILSLLATMLGQRHAVALARTGSEALAMSRMQLFDVILCDLMMPQLTGMDVYEALAVEQPELARRVVFMTGGAYTARARTFLDAVPARVLAKPFRLEQLEAALAEAVRDA